MDITLADCAERLLHAGSILVLSHSFPDGDTLGAASAMIRVLRSLGKKAAFRCEHDIPDKFKNLFCGLDPLFPEGFNPELILALDIADISLIGSLGDLYGDKISAWIITRPTANSRRRAMSILRRQRPARFLSI